MTNPQAEKEARMPENSLIGNIGNPFCNKCGKPFTYVGDVPRNGWQKGQAPYCECGECYEFNTFNAKKEPTMPDREKIGECIKLLEELPCEEPSMIPEVLVTYDMAIDAGDPEWEGQVYHKAEYHRCGGCRNCVLQQIALSILKHVQKHGMALEEGELADMLHTSDKPFIGKDAAIRLAKAIAERQQKGA